MSRACVLAAGLVISLAACGPSVSSPSAETDSGSGDEATDTDVTVESDGPPLLPGEHDNHVDILFVIDNSSSMGEEQHALAASLPVLIEALESPPTSSSYRLAFTTTDNGNPACAGTSPEAGNFVFSSCRARIGEFAVPAEMVDASAACLDVCPPEWGAIESTPTLVSGSADMLPRPWIERGTGPTNLPAGLSTVQAASCLAPQGVAGCGFESPLESMFAALSRSSSESDDEAGFLRDAALLAVVFVTDAADCSYNPASESIFVESDGVAPSSAVCWNAGVVCEPEGAAVYDSCVPADEDDAALHPVSRYVEFLQEIEDTKQALNPSEELLVAALVGVPTNYPEAPIVYAPGANGSDPTSFQAQFGIGPGCVSGVGAAVPPVRIKAVADAFQLAPDDQNLFSICDASYDAAMTAIAKTITDQFRQPCMRGCVADLDPVQQGLQPECTLTQLHRDDQNMLVETDVPECDPGDAVPEGADVCAVFLTDRNGLTPSTVDDLGAGCTDQGWNLEFRIVRRDGVAAPPGSGISPECTLSENKDVDCPGLPG